MTIVAKDKQETLEYIVNSYGFILPRNGEFSFDFWVNLIRETFSQNNPRNKEVIKFLIENKGKVKRRYGVTTAFFE